MDKRLLVAAIDFGTTFSGWAFSFHHEFLADPTKVAAKQWTSGGAVSLKAPTTVLIKPDGKTLVAFGYEAENMYAKLAVEDKHRGYYYFKLFKMMLYNKLGLTRDIMLEDDKDQQLPATTVFSLAIQYLHDDVLNTCNERLKKAGLSKDDIIWVLTVPAIWNDAAKQFMREAAEKAGILSKNLVIALEPEAASLYCRHLSVQKFVGQTDEGATLTTFSIGSKYMVLDAGGGTVDITVHEVAHDGKLKELLKASGGDWGGTKVDNSFKQMLIKIFSLPVLRKFQREATEDYIDMFRDFEVKKRVVTPDLDLQVTLRIPSKLREIFERETDDTIDEAIKQTNYSDYMTVARDKLRIDPSIYKSFFDEAIKGTVDHIKELFNDPMTKGVATILMVGGFSESRMLQAAVRTHFPNVKFIIPEEASLVVLKGAVVFGHNPCAIENRVCKYTYGIELNTLFEDGRHDMSKRFVSDGRYFCKEVFDKHVEVGQKLKYGEPQSERIYAPLTQSQNSIDVNVYASSEKDPKYVTDTTCRLVGKATVDVRDMTVPLSRRTLSVSLKFSGTEIEVSAQEKDTGKVTSSKMNFLG